MIQKISVSRIAAVLAAMSAVPTLGFQGAPLPTNALLEIASGGEMTGSILTSVSGQVTFPGNSARAGAAEIELRVHNLQYDGMLSIKVNAGPEKVINSPDSTAANSSVTDWAVNLLDNAFDYGGIGGGYHTVLLTVKLPSGVIKSTGSNTLLFNFNPLSGQDASALRVLTVRLLDASGNAIATTFTSSVNEPDTNAGTYIDVSTTAATINQGKGYWDSSALVFRPGTPGMLAKCADCHVESGGDLAYFGYTNYSIYKRARWHGLSAAEAKKLTRYIRSLATDTADTNPWRPTNPNYGRPWQPPYQPGTDVKNRTTTSSLVDPLKAKDWAAGAGLSAVLSNDSAMLSDLFSNSSHTSQAGVGWTFNTGRNEITRPSPLPTTAIGNSDFVRFQVPHVRIPLQLPDWNRWLPRIHPKDVWKAGAFSGSSSATFTAVPNSYDSDANPHARYLEAKTAITNAIDSVSSAGGYSVSNSAAGMSQFHRFAIMDSLSVIETNCREFIEKGCDTAIEWHWADFSTKGDWRALFPQWFPGGINGVDAGFNGNPGGSSGSNAAMLGWLGGDADGVRELAKRSLAAWLSVKQFELIHGNFLSHQASNIIKPDILGTGNLTDNEVSPDPLGWPLRTQSVFANAPHITANNKIMWTYPPFKLGTDGYPILFGPTDMNNAPNSGPWAVDTGYYLSVVWYHLQIVLNSGHRLPTNSVQPVDWPYQQEHIEKLYSSTGIGLPLLQTATLLKAYQAKDNLLLSSGWFVRMCEPRHLYSNGENNTTSNDNMATLDSYSSGEGELVRARLIKAAITEWLQVVENNQFDSKMSRSAVENTFTDAVTDPLTLAGVNGDVSAWQRKSTPPVGTESYWMLEPRATSMIVYPSWNSIDLLPAMNSNRITSYAKFIPAMAKYCATLTSLPLSEREGLAQAIHSFAAWCDKAWPGPDADSAAAGYQQSNNWQAYPSTWGAFTTLLD